jgi:hypothetical protein
MHSFHVWGYVSSVRQSWKFSPDFHFQAARSGVPAALRAWIVSTETLHCLASIFIVVQVAPHDFLTQPFKPAVSRKYTSMKTKNGCRFIIRINKRAHDVRFISVHRYN